MASKLEQLQAKLAKDELALAKTKELILNAELEKIADDELMAKIVGLSDGITLKAEQTLADMGIDLPVGKVITFQLPDADLIAILIEDVKDVFAQENVELTPEKVVLLTKSETGLSVDIRNAKKTKSGSGTKSAGTGRGKLEMPQEAIDQFPELEGVTSWAGLCEAFNIEHKGTSAHRTFYANSDQSRLIHDMIDHDEPEGKEGKSYHNGNGKKTEKIDEVEVEDEGDEAEESDE